MFGIMIEVALWVLMLTFCGAVVGNAIGCTKELYTYRDMKWLVLWLICAALVPLIIGGLGLLATDIYDRIDSPIEKLLNKEIKDNG